MAGEQAAARLGEHASEGSFAKAGMGIPRDGIQGRRVGGYYSEDPLVGDLQSRIRMLDHRPLR